MLDVVEDLSSDRDLVAFALERKCQRDPDRVTDAPRDELLECNPRLDDAVRRHSRLGYAEMERDVRSRSGEQDVRVDDLVRIGVLDRNDVLVEAEVVEHRAVFECGFDHRRDRVVFRILVEFLGIDRTGVHADAYRVAVRPGHVDEVAHFVANRLVAFEVVEVPGVVPELLHERGDLLGEPVVLLQIDDEVRVRAGGADLGERRDVLRIVDGDADDVGTGLFEQLDLPDRGRDVDRARRGHRLDGDRMIGADLHVADAHFARNAGFHGVVNRFEILSFLKGDWRLKIRD